MPRETILTVAGSSGVRSFRSCTISLFSFSKNQDERNIMTVRLRQEISLPLQSERSCIILRVNFLTVEKNERPALASRVGALKESIHPFKRSQNRQDCYEKTITMTPFHNPIPRSGRKCKKIIILIKRNVSIMMACYLFMKFCPSLIIIFFALIS